MKEWAPNQWWIRHLREQQRSFRFALRYLLRRSGLSLIIVMTLALAAGATTAIMTVYYATALAPLPYPNPKQLVTVWAGNAPNTSYPSAKTFIDWKEYSKPFQSMGAFTDKQFTFEASNVPRNLWGSYVTANYFRTLGSKFLLGRDFSPDVDRRSEGHEVVLTHKLWKSLGGNRDIVGREVRINQAPYTVVGVLDAGIGDRHIWQFAVPMSLTGQNINLDNHSLVVVGRLAQGVTIDQAQRYMNALSRHLWSSSPSAERIKGVSLSPLRDFLFSMSAQMKHTIGILLCAVGFVLLIACANVANLLLANGVARQREIAIRSALGAGRSRLFRQLISEILILAFAGACAGIALGYGLLRGLLVVMPRFTLPLATNENLSVPVLLSSVAVVVIMGLIFGIAPAWQAAKMAPNEVLKNGTQVGPHMARRRLQRLLVIVEFALALSVITGAVLEAQSFVNLITLNTGVEANNVLTFYLGGQSARSRDPQKVLPFYTDVLARIRAVPGVVAASVQTTTPFFPTATTRFQILGKSTGNSESSVSKAGLRVVSSDYFKTFGIGLSKGRTFNRLDGFNGMRVAMVNEAFVRKYLKGGNPLSQRLLIEGDNLGSTSNRPRTEWQIIGVDHDVRSRSMRSDSPEIQLSFSQVPSADPNIAVRTLGPPDSTSRSIASAVSSVSSVDPAIALADPRTMGQIRAQVLGNDRFSMVVFLSFGILALLLAALGVYGVVAFSVSERTRSIALRMALGADKMRVISEIITEGFKLAGFGLVVGLVAAFFVDRLMRSALFGVGVFDFRMLGLAIGVLSLALIAGCFFPARRAASIDPMQALRNE